MPSTISWLSWSRTLLHIVSRAKLSQSRVDPLHTTFGFFLRSLFLCSHRSRKSTTRRSRRCSTCSSASTSHVHVILLLTVFRITSRYVRRRSDPFAPVLLVSPLSCSCPRLSGMFLPWQHVLPLSSTVSTRRLEPTKLLCWHRLPHATTPPISPIWHRATKDWAALQNFGKKSEKRRDEWGATGARQTTELSLLSLFLSTLTLTLTHSLTLSLSLTHSLVH